MTTFYLIRTVLMAVPDLPMIMTICRSLFHNSNVMTGNGYLTSHKLAEVDDWLMDSEVEAHYEWQITEGQTICVMGLLLHVHNDVHAVEARLRFPEMRRV